MSSKCKVILLCAICSTYKLVASNNEVVLVKRNVRDSFRVEKDGCTNNASVCSSSATCQPDTGLCLCNEGFPNFAVNLIEKVSTDQYRCVPNNAIAYLVGENRVCEFSPFQVIPYRHNTLVTEFKIANRRFTYCTLPLSTKSKVKFPGDGTEMEIPWLNKSYVNLTASGDKLFFRWERSVPNLQGTIIKLELICHASKNMFGRITYEPQCFQAKVLGTWSAATQSSSVRTQPSNTPITSEIIADITTTTAPTMSEVIANTITTTKRTKSEVTTDTPTTTTRTTSKGNMVTTKTTTPDTSKATTDTTMTMPTTHHVSVTDLMTNSPPPGRPRRPQDVPGSDGDFSWILVVVTVAVPLVIVMVLVFVVCFFFKSWKKNYQTNSRRKRVESKSGASGEGQGMDLVENVPSSGATGTVVVEWSPTYSAPECQSVVVVVNPCYGVLDVKTKDDGEASSSSDHAYDTPGARKEQDKCQSDPGYESMVVVKEGDNKMEEMEGGDSRTDIAGNYVNVKKGNTKKDGSNPTPKSDKKMKASDVKNGKVDSANLYDEPGYATPDVQKDEIEGASSKSTYAKPDKKRETNDVKVKDSNDPDSYEEPGYETPDIVKEETDGTRPDATYAQPDKKRSEGDIKSGERIIPDTFEDPGYETPNLKMEDTKGSSADASYAKPKKNSTKSDKEVAGKFSADIKRVEINGDLYALPDKSKNSEKAGGSKKEENPSQVSPLLPPPQVSGPENGNESQDESSKPVAEPKTEK